MRKLLKILLYTVLALVILVGGFVGYIALKGVPHYKADIPTAISSLKVTPDSTRVARGAKIAALLCNECHKDPNTGHLTGHPLVDVPEVFGKVSSLNITQDLVHGIGAWTDGELYYFLRTGIHTDGRWSPPFMPKFPLTADEDLYSVIAWLRSDDPVLAPDAHEYPPNKYNLFVKFLANVAFFPPPLPEQTVTVPDSSNQVALGRYVADALCSCYGCHSTDFTKQDDLHPEKSFGYYAGGNPMLNREGEEVHSANLTMDKETGLGNFTEQQFLEAVKYGKNPRGGPLQYPMFPHSALSDTEVKAVWAYLQTIPAIKNPVQRYQAKN